MISVLSTTSKYILQPSLISMHRQSMAWLSATELWKKELQFFQKLLDLNAARFESKDDKIRQDHFQNLILYYRVEVIEEIRKSLKSHEASLAQMLQKENESDVQYFSDHQSLIDKAEAFENSFSEFKQDFYFFIEKGLGQ